MSESKIIEILHQEEGYKEQPYRCTEGYPTVSRNPTTSFKQNDAYRDPESVRIA
jgi:GH24 family phage-related lysozyme (muramidase)